VTGFQPVINERRLWVNEWRNRTPPAKSSYIVSGELLKLYLENGEIVMAGGKTGTASWMDVLGKH